MAFSWKSQIKKQKLKLKYRIAIMKKLGENVKATELQRRLDKLG